MKLLTTSTIALGALCVLAMNQPTFARGGGHGGGHMGGAHMGGGHMGGERHGGGYAHGGGYHHGGEYHHGGGYDHGWGYGAAGFGLGLGAGVLGTTIYNNSNSYGGTYAPAPQTVYAPAPQETYINTYDTSNCVATASGALYCY